MRPSRLLSGLALAAVAASGCASTPQAADLVAVQSGGGPGFNESEAAAAFLEYIGAVNDALETGDAAALDRVTDPACPCRDLVGFIGSRFAEGGAVEGASFDATGVTVVRRDRREAQVRATVSVTRYAVRSPDGLLVARQPAQRFVATYTLRALDDGWRVVDVHQVP